MTLRRRLLRLLAGLVVLAVALTLAFAALLPAIHRWGATDAEVARALPGDDQLPNPSVNWTNAIDIAAPPAQVWPWIAQMGDNRGGFYSFTFIENRVGALTGASGYQAIYRNADRIAPEWQRPAPGDALIQGALDIRALRTGEWLMAGTSPASPFGWTWLWQIEPLDGGARTRLINRMRIQGAEGAMNPAMTFMMDIGGFVMEQRMMHGIKLRAEGGAEPAWAEGAEIALWLAALLCGLAAAALFVLRPAWRRALIVCLAAVATLFVLTFVQPALWMRAALDAALIAGAWQAYRVDRPAQFGAPAHAPLSPIRGGSARL